MRHFARKFAVLCALGGALASCADNNIQSTPEGATGVCYIRLLASDSEGHYRERRQLVIMQSSGSAFTDLARTEVFAQDRVGYLNPDLITNVWLSAWLTEDSFDSTQGPDCSDLPAI